MKFDKIVHIFEASSTKLLSYGPLNSATHTFTRLEYFLTISDRGQIVGVCNIQTK